MDEMQKLRREVSELLLRVSSGDATEDQEARLCNLILEDADARRHVVLIMHQIATLESGATSLSELVNGGFSELEEIAVLGALEDLKKAGAASSPSSRTKVSPHVIPQECRRSIHPFITQVWSYAPLFVAMMIGVMGTILWNRYFAEEKVVSSSPSPSLAGPNDTSSPSENIVARLVSNTGDVWNASARQLLRKGDRVCKQETLTIQEGIAKLELVSGLTLHLEGPAMISIDADGMLVVQYGKVVASLPWGAKSVAVKTSLGEVQLSEDDIAGIGVFGSGLSVYVFRGDVSIGAWKNTEDEPLSLGAGEGRTLSISPLGERVVLSARPGKIFESWDSIASDLLSVSDTYVTSVRKSRPVAYWRFEKVVDGQIRNEVSDKHYGTLGGKARLVSQEANHVLEFGFGPNSGYFFVEDTLDELAGNDYAVELWVKPNHYHWGTVAGLFDLHSPNQLPQQTAFLLETVDEQAHQQHRKDSLRFLHRSPPGASPKVGKSCYSSRDYEPGKWQYVVAVKEGSKMRLYVDGKVLASAKDRTTLVSGLNLMVGRIYSSAIEPLRPFVGQIDELAVYNHALTSKEIKSRYHILR